MFPSETISKRLHNAASIFTAEAQVIIDALDQIQHLQASKSIIFTDSLSCLQALQWLRLGHPLIGIVIRRCFFLSSNKEIVFCWVPATLVLEVMKTKTWLPRVL